MRRYRNPNHKFKLGFTPTCSCGWVGVTYMGEGARGESVKEWHNHRERCESLK
jgi:hypothetical protein